MQLSKERAEKLFPEKECECPYCGSLVKIPAGLVATNCDHCHKTVFRPLEQVRSDRREEISERLQNILSFKFFGKDIPETPLIGIELPHIPYIRCPIEGRPLPVSGCMICDCFDSFRSSPDRVVCHYVDDNPDLAAAIRNKEQIIAACIRGKSGYKCTVWADGEVDEWDRG